MPRFTISMPDEAVEALDNLCKREFRDRSSMIAFMAVHWDEVVKRFNGSDAQATVAPVTGKVAPAGANTPEQKKQPTIRRKPGPRPEKPPFVYDPTAHAEGRPAYAKSVTHKLRQISDYRAPENTITLVPVQIVAEDGEPVGVRVRKDILGLLESQPTMDSDNPVQKGLDMCNPINRTVHRGIAERYETMGELLERAREVGPTDDWIEAGDETPAEPTKPTEPEDTDINSILADFEWSK